MSGFFSIGERKIRPGVYKRVVNAGSLEVAGARAGIGLAVGQSDWGELNVPTLISAGQDIEAVFGTGNLAKVISEMIAGGVQEIVAVRAGSGGSAATLVLKDTASTPVSVITLTAKCPGAVALAATIRDAVDEADTREFILYNGTKRIESVRFAAGLAEVDGLVAALAGSAYVTAAKDAAGSGTLADISQATFTAGTNPTADTAAYSAALAAAEAEEWDVICVDTVDPAVHAVVSAFCDRVYTAGLYPMAVIAEAASTALATRISHAIAYNSDKIVFLLNGWKDAAGETHDGYLAAARIGGMIAAAPANVSMTHRVVSGAVSLSEALTVAQINQALKSGCLVLTMSRSRQIWIEQGINTLVTLTADQDAGWKKIRRLRTRYELMRRIEETVEPLIGITTNDENGRATIISAAQRVIDAMYGEGKLREGGEIAESAEYKAEGDSAWFDIAVDDLDSLEHIYLTFRFRFSPES